MKTPLTQREKLQKREWRVHTNDSMTQNAIMEYLTNDNEKENARVQIFYDGRPVDVFIVTFTIVMFLAKNETKAPYTFTAYHRPSKTVPWAMWKKLKTSPLQAASKLDNLFNAGRNQPLSAV